MKTQKNAHTPIIYGKKVRKGVGTGYNSNCIDAHEDVISSTLESASNRLDRVNQRLNKFQSKCHNEAQSQEIIDWIRHYRYLEEEAASMFKCSKNASNFIAIPCVEDGKEFKMFEDDINTCKYETRNRIETLLDLLHQNKGIKSHSNTEWQARVFDIFHKLRSKHSKEVECINDQCNGLEKELQCSRQDLVHSKHSEKQLIPDETMQELKGFNELCNCAKANDLIDDKFHTDISSAIEKITIEFENLNKTCRQSLDKSFEGCQHNNQAWDKKKNAILINEFKQWKKMGKSRNQKKFCIERIAKQTNEHLRVCTQQWHRMENGIHLKMRDNVGRSEQKKEQKEKVVANLKQFHDLRSRLIERAWNDLNRSVSNAMDIEKQFRLDCLREIKALSQSIEEDKIAIKRCKEDEENKSYEQRKEKERLDTRNALEEYHNLKHVLETKQMVEREERLHEEEEFRKQRLFKNIKRVSFRNVELMKKNQKRHDLKEKAKEEEISKIKKLNALAASVPYHASIIAKKADLSKSTAARMNDIYESSSDTNLMDFQQGLKQLKGFTDKKVFSDPKFRLAHALHESGKANSAYSLAIVNQLIPRIPERTTGIGDTSK